MASKCSKIPKMNRSSLPSSPRGNAGQNPGNRADPVKTLIKANTPLSFPRQTSQLPLPRASPSPAIPTPKRTGSVKSPHIKPPGRQCVQRPSMVEKAASDALQQQSVAATNKSCEPDLLAGVTSKTNDVQSVLVDTSNDELEVKTIHVPNEISKDANNDDQTSTEELENAFIGLIMPTSEKDFSQYLHLTKISETALDSLHETLAEKAQVQRVPAMNESKCLPSVESSVSSASTEPTITLLTELVPNPPPGIFDATSFSESAENNDLVPEDVKLRISEHAESLFSEFAEAAAQKSVSLRLDCDRMTGLERDLMHGIMKDDLVNNDTVANGEDLETFSSLTDDLTEDQLRSQEIEFEQLVSHDDTNDLLGPSLEYESDEEMEIVQCPVETDEEVEILQFPAESENEVEDEINGKNLTSALDQANYNRTSCNKKTKTIFSVDVPLAQVNVESGPGENGDGRDVHSPLTQSKSNATDIIFSSSSMKSTCNAFNDGDGDCHYNNYMPEWIPPRKTVSCSGANHQNVSHKLDLGKIGDQRNAVIEKAVNGIVQKWTNAGTKQASSSNVFQGAVKENKSAPNMTTAPRHENKPQKEWECKALFPKNLILQQESRKNKMFSKIVPIHNPTSSLYAFKVCCGEFARTHFTAFPDIGLLQPHCNAFVEIKATTANVGKQNQEVLPNGKIAIKIFPACCAENDPEKLEQVYQTLSAQRSDLIYTQSPNRVIIWESGNLKRNMEILNSIEDKKERKDLKKDLHDCQSTLFGTLDNHSYDPGNETAKSLLRSIREQLCIANNHLKQTFQEVITLRDNQSVVIFLCFLIFIVAVAPPVRHIYESSMKQEEAPDSWYDKILKSVYLK